MSDADSQYPPPECCCCCHDAFKLGRAITRILEKIFSKILAINSVCYNINSILSVGEVIKTCIFSTEGQLNLPYRTVTLLSNDNFRLALVG